MTKASGLCCTYWGLPEPHGHPKGGRTNPLLPIFKPPCPKRGEKSERGRDLPEVTQGEMQDWTRAWDSNLCLQHWAHLPSETHTGRWAQGSVFPTEIDLQYPESVTL